MQTVLSGKVKLLLKQYCLPILVIIFMLVMVMPAAIEPRTKSISEGRLDLGHVHLTNDSRLPLNGEWAFYWNQFLCSSELRGRQEEPDLYADVPSVWNNYRIDGEKLPAFGYATYHLRVTGADPNQSLMMYMDSVSTAYALYIDDEWVAGNGTVTRTVEGFVPYNQPRLINFQPPAESFDIVIHVSNFVYARGGVWYQINLGTERAIRNQYTRMMYKDALLLGSLLIMALYHLNYFLLLREFFNGIAILLLDLVMMVRISLYGDYLILRLLPRISFDQMVRINYLTLYWAPVLFFVMIDNLFFHEKKKTAISRIMIAYGLVMSVLTLLLPISLVTSWVYLAEAVLAVIFVLTLAKIVQAWRMKIHGADVILLTTLAVFFLILHDVFYQMNLIVNDYGELTPLGLSALLFMMSMLTSGRFLDSYHERRVLQHQLDQAKSIEQRLKSQVKHFHDVRTAGNETRKKQMKVCIISNDDTLTMDLVESTLQADCRVITNLGDDSFLNSLAKMRPADMILLDLRTSSVSGFEILRRIRRIYTPIELPVLLITDRENHEEAAAGFWLGANDVIGKPYSQSELLVRLNNLIEMQDWIERNVNAELAFLQAQIKPHFIFNTLSVIASQCHRNPENAHSLLLDLSDYLRESFDFSARDGLISLDRELNLVTAYLSIEQARFHSRLEVVFDVDQLPDCRVPLLCVQPIVENAVQHGLMQRAEGGRITVRAKKHADALHVQIGDTGVGMNAQRIEQIFLAERKEGNVGLRNIHHRLLNLYGKGLQIVSQEGEGTQVSFEIPVDYGMPKNEVWS